MLLVQLQLPLQLLIALALTRRHAKSRRCQPIGMKQVRQDQPDQADASR